MFKKMQIRKSENHKLIYGARPPLAQPSDHRAAVCSKETRDVVVPGMPKRPFQWFSVPCAGKPPIPSSCMCIPKSLTLFGGTASWHSITLTFESVFPYTCMSCGRVIVIPFPMSTSNIKMWKQWQSLVKSCFSIFILNMYNMAKHLRR